MKQILTAIAVATVVAAASFADGEESLSPQEKRARRKARIEARIAAEGGMLQKDNTENFARVVNCQKKVSTEIIIRKKDTSLKNLDHLINVIDHSVMKKRTTEIIIGKKDTSLKYLRRLRNVIHHLV